jgi:hypothetical protein
MQHLDAIIWIGVDTVQHTSQSPLDALGNLSLTHTTIAMGGPDEIPLLVVCGSPCKSLPWIFGLWLVVFISVHWM